jgi:hypothetical protein
MAGWRDDKRNSVDQGAVNAPKRRRDPNQYFKSIKDIAMGQKPDRDHTPEDQGSAVALRKRAYGAGCWPNR